MGALNGSHQGNGPLVNQRLQVDIVDSRQCEVEQIAREGRYRGEVAVEEDGVQDCCGRSAAGSDAGFTGRVCAGRRRRRHTGGGQTVQTYPLRHPSRRPSRRKPRECTQEAVFGPCSHLDPAVRRESEDFAASGCSYARGRRDSVTRAVDCGVFRRAAVRVQSRAWVFGCRVEECWLSVVSRWLWRS